MSESGTSRPKARRAAAQRQRGIWIGSVSSEAGERRCAAPSNSTQLVSPWRLRAERALYPVEPIYRVLAIAPSGYFTYRARLVDPTRRPARAQRDDLLREEVQRVWERNRGVYGVRKVRQQLWRDEQTVARHTVCLAAAGAAPSVGSVDVDMATLEWVAWFNQERLLALLGCVPPAEFEAQYYDTHHVHTSVGVLNETSLLKTQGNSHYSASCLVLQLPSSGGGNSPHSCNVIASNMSRARSPTPTSR